MKTGDIALVKKYRLTDDPFQSMSIEMVMVPGKVISVHYPSFTVKFDQPTPDGYEFQEFHVNHIAEKAVEVKDGNLTSVLSVVRDITVMSQRIIDPSNPESALAQCISALARLEAICKEHLEA